VLSIDGEHAMPTYTTLYVSEEQDLLDYMRDLLDLAREDLSPTRRAAFTLSQLEIIVAALEGSAKPVEARTVEAA
jgi:hypothetical protein